MGSPFHHSFFRHSRVTWLILLAFISAATLGAGSMKKGKDEMEVIGTVYLMGNEPFTYVALKMGDGQVYALLGKHEKELRQLQGRRVTVIGKPSQEKPRGANAIEVKSFKVVEQK